MAYRGRLIYPFMIELKQLDLVATATAGYDDVFREPKILASADGIGTSAREESTIALPGQFNRTDAFLQLQQMATGNVGRTSLVVLFHFEDLESLGLVEASTGLAKIKVGDRLSAVYEMDGTTLVQKIPASPGAFVIAANPLMGLRSKRNLLEVKFGSRDASAQVV